MQRYLLIFSSFFIFACNSGGVLRPEGSDLNFWIRNGDSRPANGEIAQPAPLPGGGNPAPANPDPELGNNDEEGNGAAEPADGDEGDLERPEANPAEDAFKILTVSPSGQDLDLIPEITITFNRKLAEVIPEEYIRLYPCPEPQNCAAVEAIRSIQEEKYTFTPKQKLSPEQEYTLLVSFKVRSLDDATLAAEEKFTFKTRPARWAALQELDSGASLRDLTMLSNKSGSKLFALWIKYTPAQGQVQRRYELRYASYDREAKNWSIPITLSFALEHYFAFPQLILDNDEQSFLAVWNVDDPNDARDDIVQSRNYSIAGQALSPYRRIGKTLDTGNRNFVLAKHPMKNRAILAAAKYYTEAQQNGLALEVYDFAFMDLQAQAGLVKHTRFLVPGASLSLSGLKMQLAGQGGGVLGIMLSQERDGQGNRNEIFALPFSFGDPNQNFQEVGQVTSNEEGGKVDSSHWDMSLSPEGKPIFFWVNKLEENGQPIIKLMKSFSQNGAWQSRVFYRTSEDIHQLQSFALSQGQQKLLASFNEAGHNTLKGFDVRDNAEISNTELVALPEVGNLGYWSSAFSEAAKYGVVVWSAEDKTSGKLFSNGVWKSISGEFPAIKNHFSLIQNEDSSAYLLSTESLENDNKRLIFTRVE